MRELALVASDLSWEGPSAEYGIVAGRGRDDWAARAARSACWESCDMFLAGEGREQVGGAEEVDSDRKGDTRQKLQTPAEEKEARKSRGSRVV